MILKIRKLKNIRRIFIIAFITLCFNSTKAQIIGASVGLIKPSGQGLYYFKPNVGFELTYGSFLDKKEHLYAQAGIGYFSLAQRADTMVTWGVLSDGNGTRITPGYMIYKNFFDIPISIQIYYFPFKWVVSPFIGIDTQVHLLSFDYLQVNALINKDYSGGAVGIGLQPKIGAWISLNDDCKVGLSIGQTGLLTTEYGSFGYWNVNASFHYNLDR